MLIVNKLEGNLIKEGFKISSLRPIRANNKGYLTVGSIQQIRIGRNFKEPFYCRVLIYSRDFVNIDNLTSNDFKRLGYPNRESYMAQSYNKRNSSPERVQYYFIELENLFNLVYMSPNTIKDFYNIWELVKECPSITEGVNESRINGECEKEAIAEEIATIRANIWGLIQ